VDDALHLVVRRGEKAGEVEPSGGDEVRGVGGETIDARFSGRIVQIPVLVEVACE